MVWLLVNKFDHEYPDRFAEEIFNYLTINKNEFPVAHKVFEEPSFSLQYFNDLCNTFRSPHIWKYSDGKWVLRSPLK